MDQTAKLNIIREHLYGLITYRNSYIPNPYDAQLVTKQIADIINKIDKQVSLALDELNKQFAIECDLTSNPLEVVTKPLSTSTTLPFNKESPST